MKIKQFYNKNQFTIENDGDIFLQSYKSIVCKIDKNGTITLGKDWDYSQTTRKHLYLFLREYSNILNGVETNNTKDYLQKMIDNKYILYKEEL